MRRPTSRHCSNERLRRCCRKPGRSGCLVTGDIGLLSQRQRNLVPTVEQALAVERVDRERRPERAGANTLGRQVDRDLHAGLLGCEADQLANLILRKLDWEQPAAKAVAL